MANLFRLRINVDYLRFIIKRNRRFILLMTTAMLIVFPVLYLTTLAINPNTNHASIRSLGQGLVLFLLIVSSIILPILLFSYMNKKKDLDVYHALPIKQGDLFVTTSVASFYLMIIPFIFSWCVGNLISLDINYSWLNMLENGFTSILIAFSISSIVTLALVHVGTSLDGILYAGLLNIIPILAYLSYNLFRSIIFLGFNQNISNKIIGLLFPIWSIYENNYSSTSRLFESSILNGVYWFIWAMILLSLSRVVYINRKHEKAESAFTNNYFYPLISSFFMILLIFIMYSLFYTLNINVSYSYYHPVNFVFPFFFAGLIYLILDTISQRSFKNLFKAMLKYCVIALVGFSFLFLGLFSRSFSFVSRIPKLDDIQSVEFKIEDYDNSIFTHDYITSNYSNDSYSMTITNPEDIQTILDFHQIILNEYAWINYSTSDQYRYNSETLLKAINGSPNYVSSYESYPYSYTYASNISISIVYNMTSGRNIARQYYVPYEWTKILYSLYASDSVLNFVAPSLAYSDNYSELSLATLREYSNKDLVKIENLDLSTLKEAYLQDMQNWNQDSYLDLQGPTFAVLNLQTKNKFNETFESDIVLNNLTPNTNAYLKSLANFPTISSDIEKMYLLIPQENESNPIFYKASAAGSWNYAYAKEGTKYTSIEVDADLYAKIQPFTTQVGLSNEPLLSLVVYEKDYIGINLDNYGYMNNLLIKPEYQERVYELIKDYPQSTSTDLYQFAFK